MLEPSQLIQSVFYGMAALLGTLALNTLRSMSNSINELNVKIAVVISELKNHDARIASLESSKTKGEK